MRAKDLRARHIKGCMEDGTYVVDGKEKHASPTTKTKIKSLFNLMLDYALEYELVDKNYARTFNLSDDVIKDVKEAKKDHIDFTDEEIKKLNENRTKDGGYCATFAGQNIKFDGEKFNGTELTAVFGGVKCDLTKAIIENDVVINATSVFGGIEIYVPDDVNVKIKSSSIFGGVSEKRKSDVKNENSHTIYVNATCIFGGVDIK